MIVDPLQIKAARALLGISQQELAEASGLSHRTVVNMELGKSSRQSIQRAVDCLLDRGITFDGGPTGRSLGVLHQPTPKTPSKAPQAALNPMPYESATGDGGVKLDAGESEDFLRLLLHGRSASNQRIAARIEEMLDRISRDGRVQIDVSPRLPPPGWAIAQPRIASPEEPLFPLPYPNDFGRFPICLAFWESPLKSHLLANGYETLDDLSNVRIRDVAHVDGFTEEHVNETRRRVDAILAEKPLPPRGYRMLPRALTPEMSAVSLMDAISDYLPLKRRRTFRLAFNVDGDARSLAEVARVAGVAPATPKDIIRNVFWTLSTQYDWRPGYEALTGSNGAASERWLTGIHPKLRPHLDLIRKRPHI